jgi:hypothetical protein
MQNYAKFESNSAGLMIKKSSLDEQSIYGKIKKFQF